MLDEPATARALADFLLRGLDCGALSARRGRRGDRARHADALAGWRTAPAEGEADGMGIVLGPNRYGKAENRVVRIVRDTPRHEIRDLNVSTSLCGDFAAAHTDGDQSQVLPTDTQKNTAFAYAKKHGVTSPEDYALALGGRLLEATPGGEGRGGARRGVRLGPDPGRRPVTTTRSSVAAARCAPRVDVTAAERPSCPACRTWSC